MNQRLKIGLLAVFELLNRMNGHDYKNEYNRKQKKRQIGPYCTVAPPVYSTLRKCFTLPCEYSGLKNGPFSHYFHIYFTHLMRKSAKSPKQTCLCLVRNHYTSEPFTYVNDFKQTTPKR